MASIVKQIGTGEEKDAWAECVRCGSEAIDVLRQTEDRAALADALSGAFVYLIPAPDREALCLEALAISRELGYKRREGWSIFALAMMGYPRQLFWKEFSIADAFSCFEDINDKLGMATCLQIQGAGRENGRWRANLKAASLFEEERHFKDAVRAYEMAAIWGGDDLSAEEAEVILLKGRDCAKSGNLPKSEAQIYGRLKGLWEARGNPERAAMYRDLEDQLDEVVHGSRENRLRHEISMIDEILPAFRGKDRKELLKKRALFEVELKGADS